MSTWCVVEKPNGDIDKVRAQSMSFDGGSLILFSDREQREPKAAYSPVGWSHWRWASDGEVRA